MGLSEALELEQENQRVANELRLACDRLNDALTVCARAGLTVDIDLVPVTQMGDSVPRSLVVVKPLLIIPY